MQRKKRLVFSDRFAHEQFETSVGSFKLVAFEFELFHFFNNFQNDRIVFLNRRIEFFNLFDDHAAPGNFAHEEHAGVSDAFGGDVFVRIGIFNNRIDVHARFVRKRIRADIGQLRIQGDIRDFGYSPRDRCKRFQLFVRKAGIAHLQLQVGDDGRKVCVSRTLSEAEKRSLYVAGSRFNRNERVRNGKPRIVVRVDTDKGFASEMRTHIGNRFFTFVDEAAARRFAKREYTGSPFDRSFERFQRIVSIVPVAGKKMFGVVDDTAVVFR